MDTLLLNSDAQPLSHLPLSTLTWQESIKYMVLDKARVLCWHDNWVVRSVNWETPVPSIMMLTQYMKPKSSVRFSKSNVFLRDRFVCQYCNAKLEKRHCTLDHVLPISKGGKTSWDNSVTSCNPCNSKKSDSIKMKPKSQPRRPDYWELVAKKRELGFQIKDPAWLDYLG
jgi:5-methylcytosine-specific restriction endonuclease McrA